MTDLFLLSRVQMRRIERYFPLSHGIARVDDRRIVSAIVFVIKNGQRWFRAALAKRGIAVCIPSKSNRKVAIPYDALLYKQRHKIENMFGRLKDWRRIHTRYDRCAHTYLSAISIAAFVLFWL